MTHLQALRINNAMAEQFARSVDQYINKTLQSFGIYLISNYFAVMIIDTRESLRTNSQIMMVSMAVSEITRNTNSSNCRCYAAELSSNNFGILLNLLSNENMEDFIASVAVAYIDQLKTKYGIKVYIYIGNCLEGIDRIHHSMEQARMAMNYHVVMPDY